MEDDRVLIERMRAGDGRAFETLTSPPPTGLLRRVARTFVRTPAAADEVVQETWLGVVRGLDGFEGRSSLRTWIFRILANVARTRAVQDARSVPFSSLEVDDEPALEPSAFAADGSWASSARAARRRSRGSPPGSRATGAPARGRSTSCRAPSVRSSRCATQSWGHARRGGLTSC